MVIDPVCSIVFEAEGEESNVMNRPPRAPNAPLFSAALVGWSLLQGLFVFLLVAAVYVFAIRKGMPENEVRALAFVSLVMTNVGLILVNRSFSTSLAAAFRHANRILWIILAAIAALLGLVLAWAPTRELFRFGPLHADDLALCAAAGIALLVLLDLLKRFWRTHLQS